MKLKQPAATYLVFEYLLKRTAIGEFSTVDDIHKATGVSKGNVASALWALQNYFSAVEAVKASGELHWLATPESDKRIRQIKERAPETAPRKRKQRRQP